MLKSPFFCTTLTFFPFTTKPGELIAIKSYFATNYKRLVTYS